MAHHLTRVSILGMLMISSCAKPIRLARVEGLPRPQNVEPQPATQPATPQPPATQAVTKRVKSMPTDQPDKAAEFYLLKRVGSGVPDLPYEKYEVAQRRLDRMPVFPLSGTPIRKTSERHIDLGGWEPLGPGNQGGRSRHLLIHPTNPLIMYVSATTGGVWKTVDGGRNWSPLTDLFPSLGIGALAFDPGNPDTLYVGTGFWFNTLSGTNVFGTAIRGTGIYRSRDAGATWQPLGIPPGLHFRYINKISVSRHDPNRLYAATWTGIFRSADGGQNWTRVLNRGTGAQNGCQDMVARTDQATDYLFAACGTSAAGAAAIFRHPDAASDAPWQPVFTPPAMGNTTLALAPSSQGTIYALTASNGDDKVEWRSALQGVYRSTTNGDPNTWEPRVTNDDPEPLNTSLLSSNQAFFSNVCSTGERSVGGQGWIHNAIAVDPQDPDRVFVGGIDIYRSDDGGRNWGIASFWQAADGLKGAHADVLGLIFPPDYDGATKPNLYAITDGGVYLTESARAALAVGPRAACTNGNLVHWRPLHGGYQSTQFYSGAVMPGGGAFFGGKQDNGTMRGTLAGKGEWVRLRGGDGAAVAVDPRDANVLFTSTQNFGLARSRNGGRTFSATLRGIAEPAANFSFIAPLAMDPTNPDRLYAGARRFYRTTNQADNWEAMSTELTTAQGTVSAIAVSPSDPQRVMFATSQGFILRANDALAANGDTVWEATRPRPGYVPGLTFDPTNSDIVYATYSQFNTAAGQHHVYRSIDGGRNWQGIDREGDSGVPDLPVFTILVDPLDPQRLYLGTDLGVIASLDGGNSWTRDVNPFATVPTESLVLERGSGVTYLYAFTLGRGVWRTALPGTGAPCDYAVDDLPPLSAAFGGVLTINLRTGPECAWSAIGQTADIQTPSSGRGPAGIRATLPLNFATAARRFNFSVQDKALTTQQAAAMAVPAAADAIATPATVATLPYVGIRDTRTATVEPRDPQGSCAPNAPAKTIWWRVTAPASGTMEAVFQSQRYDVFGNSGVVVSAFAAEGTSVGSELGCQTIPRNTTAYVFQTFQFPVTAGESYFLQASATGTTPTDGGYTILGLRMTP